MNIATMRQISRREQRQRTIRAILKGQYGVIHRRQLLAEGMSDGAVARACHTGRLKRVHPSVYLDGAAQLGWHQSLMAAHLWCGEEGWFSHRSAAALFGLDGIDPGTIEMTLLRKTDPPSGVIVHVSDRVPECDVQTVGRFPATTPTRTLIDLGAVVDRDVVEVALECALRWRWTSIPRLRWRLDELGRHGRRGAAVMRTLLDQRRPGTAPAESALEVKLIQLIRKSNLPMPERQHVVKHKGKFLGRVDLAYPSAKVAIEVDSSTYHLGMADWRADLARGCLLTSAGWLVLHFTNEDLKNPTWVIECIGNTLAARNP